MRMYEDLLHSFVLFVRIRFMEQLDSIRHQRSNDTVRAGRNQGLE